MGFRLGVPSTVCLDHRAGDKCQLPLHAGMSMVHGQVRTEITLRRTEAFGWVGRQHYGGGDFLKPQVVLNCTGGLVGGWQVGSGCP